MNKLDIFPAAPAAIHNIVDFQVKMALETENLALDPDTVKKGVKYILENPSAGYYLLAYANRKVVASLMVLYEWSDWRNGNVLWIHSVYVVPEFRKQGIFRQMYAHLREKVEQEHSLKGLRLYVDSDNLTAKAVYEKLGMSSEHYDLYEWLKDK